MVKKKPFEWKNPMLWGGAIVSLGIVFTFLTKFVDFIRIPEALAATEKKIEVVKEDVEDVKDYIKEQRIQNQLMQKMVDKDKKQILSPDGKFYFEEETGKWRKVTK